MNEGERVARIHRRREALVNEIEKQAQMWSLLERGWARLTDKQRSAAFDALGQLCSAERYDADAATRREIALDLAAALKPLAFAMADVRLAPMRSTPPPFLAKDPIVRPPRAGELDP